MFTGLVMWGGKMHVLKLCEGRDGGRIDSSVAEYDDIVCIIYVQYIHKLDKDNSFTFHSLFRGVFDRRTFDTDLELEIYI